MAKAMALAFFFVKELGGALPARDVSEESPPAARSHNCRAVHCPLSSQSHKPLISPCITSANMVAASTRESGFAAPQP